MEKIAQFYKVSEEQFINDWRAATGSSIEEAKSVYANIRLPRRATKGSAGYDFFAPESFTLDRSDRGQCAAVRLSALGRLFARHGVLGQGLYDRGASRGHGIRL